jgi:hypothetical protein
VSESDTGLCTEHFPEPAEIARLAENAQAGRYEAFVGTGDPGTVLSCEHGQWPLAVVVASVSDESATAACTETTAAGEPCKNAPGEDGLCGIHRKQKEAAADSGDSK